MGDSLGDRMKQYEAVSSNKLVRRMPVVLRIDGKAFHTYTKRCEKPFDNELQRVREAVLEYLCNNIQGAVIGYSQSDELSIVLKDWTKLTTSSWFDNKVQKICSVAASMCTMVWNNYTREYDTSLKQTAMFDTRVFNLPKEEVVNYLIWRQQDWERNSVQMLARSVYSHKELDGVSCKQAITKLEDEYGIVWGNLPDTLKQGEVWVNGSFEQIVFKNSREYLNNILNYVEE